MDDRKATRDEAFLVIKTTDMWRNLPRCSGDDITPGFLAQAADAAGALL